MHFLVSLLNLRPGRIGGAETYLRALVSGFAQSRRDDRITLLIHRDLEREFADSRLDRHVVAFGERGVTLRRGAEALSGWRARRLEREIDRLAPDAMLFPQQSLFPRLPPCPAVLTVFDLYHLQPGSALPLAERIFRRGIYGHSLRRADRLIAISECTRQALIQQAGIAPERVVTVPLGFAATPARIPDRPASVIGRYVYYPAATWPAKNHAVLFETLARVRRCAEWGDRQLVLSGIQTRLWPRLKRLADRLGLSDIVRHLGYVPATEVQALYAGAEAVLFPSQFEGFGLPVLEAAALGKKIIVSQLEVFRELGVPERFRIDFAQPEQLLRALAEPGPTVLEKSPATWDECTARTLEVLRDTARRPQ